ncbi:MAG: hypothetical protein KDA61_08610, partial [Planctomycetales bacterium]|nr:hypothetical protein [Planctomycetales bacterium]
MAEVDAPRPRLHIPMLVWTLAALGASGGVATVGIANYVMRDIQHRRSQLESVQAGLDESVAELRNERERLAQEISSVVSGEPLSLAAETRAREFPLRQLLNNCRQRFADLGAGDSRLVEPFDELDHGMRALHAMRSSASHAADQLSRATAERLLAIDVVRAAVARIRAVVEQSEGSRRLAAMQAVRTFRKSDVESRGASAKPLIDRLLSDRQLSGLKADLNDVALLTEQIIGETDLSQLASLKDNRLRQSLGRLHREAAKL